MAMVEHTGSFTVSAQTGTNNAFVFPGRDVGTLRQTFNFGTVHVLPLRKVTCTSGSELGEINSIYWNSDQDGPYNWPVVAASMHHPGLFYEHLAYATATSGKGQVALSGDPKFYYRNKPLRSRGRTYRGPNGSEFQRGI